MKIVNYDGSDERTVLTAMIVNDGALRAIAARWEPQGLFASPWANEVAKLCIDFHKSAGKAPGKAISALFRSWAERRRESDESRVVSEFLASLSEDYPRRAVEVDNTTYIVNLAAKHFSLIRYSRMADEVKAATESRQLGRAEEAHRSLKQLAMGQAEDANLLRDEAGWRESLETIEEVVVEYPGDAGRFFGHSLCRGGFVAIMAAEKRGKTSLLVDISWRALLQRRRVAFFEVGDMTKNQIYRRFHARACGRPVRARKIKIPTKLDVSGFDPVVTHEEIDYDEPLSLDEVRKGYSDVIRHSVRSAQDYFKLHVCAAGTMTVDTIRDKVDAWCQDGWVPDVCIIDYSDLLHAPGQDDYRHRTNEIWTKLRALSQCPCEPLVVTASQTNRGSYKAKSISMEHTGEDKRKLAHVTAAFGINQTDEERKAGVLRLNSVVIREEERQERGVYMAPCLSISNFCVLSAFTQSQAATDEPSRVREGQEDSAEKS